MGSDHADELLGYLVALTRDPMLADELLIAVISDAASADAPKSPRRTWLYGLAWQAFDRRGRPVAPSTAANAVSALRDGLDPEEHSVLILHVDRGMPFDEIADVMRLDEDGVARIFAEIAGRLRRLAARAGLVGA
jgi:DNA-directed RNA polymerase specialized sigma24 family protein